MEQFCGTISLFVLFCAVCPERPARRVVAPGSSVFLDCAVRHQHETMWFVQHGDEAPYCALSARLVRGEAEPPRIYTYGARRPLRAEPDAASSSIGLRIENVSQAHLGLYFCADKVEGNVRVGAGIRLVYAAERNDSVSLPAGHEYKNESLYRNQSPEPCGLCWALLAAVLVLSTVVSSVCVYCVCPKPAPKKSGKRDGDGLQAPGEVTYAAVDAGGPAGRADRCSPAGGEATYSAVRHPPTPLRGPRLS